MVSRQIQIDRRSKSSLIRVVTHKVCIIRPPVLSLRKRGLERVVLLPSDAVHCGGETGD